MLRTEIIACALDGVDEIAREGHIVEDIHRYREDMADGLAHLLEMAAVVAEALAGCAPTDRCVMRGMASEPCKNSYARIAQDLDQQHSDTELLARFIKRWQQSEQSEPSAPARAGASVADTPVITPAHPSPITPLPPAARAPSSRRAAPAAGPVLPLDPTGSAALFTQRGEGV